MNKLLHMSAGAIVVFAASTGVSFAGGVDRSGQFLGPLFEDGGETGSFARIGLGRVNPSAAAPNLGVSNPLGGYNIVSLAYKTDLSERLSIALIIDEPYGADIAYALASPFAGGGASVSSEQVSAVLRYKFDDNWSVVGGIRALQVDGRIDTFAAAPVPGGLAPISVQADAGFDFGGVVGIAYERPEIALRVALSYNTSVSSKFSGSESIFTDATRTTAAATGDTSFTVEFPESINLEFQTGIAKDTLLFGSVRHAFYDGVNLTTPANTALFGGALGPQEYVNFVDDTTAFEIGVGRRFNEQWSAAISFGYEGSGTRPASTALAPTTGTKSVSLGATYRADALSISGGVSYIIPGDQLVNSPAGVASFDDNDAVAVGVSISYNF